VLPKTPEHSSLRAILTKVIDSGKASFLSVMKEFGDIPSPGIMSFPREGITLTLDFANQGAATQRLLNELDSIVRDAGGALYPAKDACMSPESYREYYPDWKSFSEFVDPHFSSSFWRRVTGE
jgi:hypothetical protein